MPDTEQREIPAPARDKRAIGVECARVSTGNRGRGYWEWKLPERVRIAA